MPTGDGRPATADRRMPTAMADGDGRPAMADRRMPAAMAEAHLFDGPRKSQEIAVPAVLVRHSHSGTQGGVLHSQVPEHGAVGWVLYGVLWVLWVLWGG